MKVLITGGAGFIGSHLAEACLDRDYDVYIIDNLSTGSITNIDHLRNNDRFEYVIDTIMNKPLTAEYVDRCDLIFHMAAAVGVKLIVESPVNTIETNIKGTEVILELADKKKKKVIVASTSEVYGKSDSIPFAESDDMVMGPSTKGRWSYACSKAIDEFLAVAYWKEKGLPVVIARLFNTVGPRQTGQYGMVIPTFVKQALNGEPITVFGDGSQSRSFTYVGDAVEAMIGLSLEEKAVGEVFNIGNNQEISIKELAGMVRNMTGSSSEIKFVPYEEAYEEGFEDMPRRVPDISKINEYIGYEPTLNIEEILGRVIDHFRGDTNQTR